MQLEQLELLSKFLSQENIKQLIDFIDNFGIIAGIGLPTIETFFPFLPLVLLVTLNVFFFGLFPGYILSWIGNCIGSILLFMVVRYIRKKKPTKINKQTKYQKIKNRINKNDFSFVFILLCFPFTPSFAVTIISAISDINIKHFLIALLPSKLIMIFSLAIIGYNLSSFWNYPGRSILFLVGVILINFAGKKFINFYQNKFE